MDLETIFKVSITIRMFEENLDELFKKGLIRGTAHFCTGQEFIPTIICQYLNDEDAMTSTHRGHGHALAKGLDLKKFLAELMGLASGFNFGKGGSQHVMNKNKNFYANGITGGMIPVANGLAFAKKYNSTKNIVVSFVGDGGMNEGFVLESLNMAKIFELPILIICENNQYAMSSHVEKMHSAPIIQKVKGFGIKSELIENNDYKKLDKIAKEYIKEIREENSPRFIEIRTYRHKGHSKNDMNLYRKEEEEEKWHKKDAIKEIEKEIIENKILSKEKIEEIKKGIENKIKKFNEELKNEKHEIKKETKKYVYAE